MIPAAGIGTRLKADKPKQYLKIHGQTLLERVVNLFSEQKYIEKVVVVLHAQDHWWSQLTLNNPEKILTVIGGKERVHSVLLGLDFLNDFVNENDFVLVHDAARPCLQAKDIIHLISELKNNAVGGLLGLPIVDTLKRVDKNNAVIETVSRDHLWQAQTPQCFRYDLLKSAIKKALSENKVITDESSAIENAGHHPKVILGDAHNIKITFADDLILAGRFI
ncbi:MAG: 2-C-methyl-D-erythritol 4-phosphate cytidylyltransferase [Gammaproteobacteria bacterium RIFCSPHIGHO2_12_FULL_38_11]|nr:MAG: 2-C-methyl-D-erythritol 4-phosphate cytidylyltransferase [Gammaproteobacteria bacterium RIFCSPHIGHO2_12_FULL_38_11]